MRRDEALSLQGRMMAGPLSNEEIEDVVSSVRRLVSNEQRPRPLSRDLNSERLVLTPAQRVVSETSPLSPLILATPIDEPVPPVAVEGAEEARDRPASVWAEAESDVILVEADWEDDIWAEEEPSLAEVALGADEAEVVPAPTEPEPEAQPGAGTDADGWMPGEADWSAAEPIPFIPLRRRAEILAARLAGGGHADDAAPKSEPEPEPEASEPLAASVTDTQADVASFAGEQDPEPDDMTFALAQESEPRLITDPDDPGDHLVGPGTATELVDADGSPIAVLDEAGLQEIVRQMIRQELQGELGERITRNVRKLVRAEINRALIARDLD